MQVQENLSRISDGARNSAPDPTTGAYSALRPPSCQIIVLSLQATSKLRSTDPVYNPSNLYC